MSNRHGILLCYPFEEKRLAKWTPPFIVQPKLDGERCRAVITNGHVQLLSSECNEKHSVPHITAALERIFVGQTLELDGEAYRHGWSFEQIHSVFSRDASNLHPDYEQLQYHVFDIVTTDPQLRRTLQWAGLPWADKLLTDDHSVDPILNVPFTLQSSLDGILSTFQSYCSDGYEGIIVRHPDAPYIRRRSTMVMKFKPKKDDYYEIVGFQEEISIEGQPKGRLGALICRAPNTAGQNQTDSENLFSVGSGFTATDREKLWEVRLRLPGNLLHVVYQHITPDRGVPRFPVYKEILWTKGEPT